MSCIYCLAPSKGKACSLHAYQYEADLKKRQAQEMERRANRIAGIAPGLAQWLHGEAERITNS